MKLDWIQTIIGDSYTEEMDTAICKELGQRFVSKTDFNSKLEEIKGLNSQITERDSQLKKLKDSAGDNEELKNQIQKLQDENKNAKSNFEKEINDLRFASALDNALLKAKAIDTDLVKVKLDKESLKLNEDGTLSGIDEQLKSVQENFGFLFESAQETKIEGITPVESGGNQTESDPFLQGFGQ